MLEKEHVDDLVKFINENIAQKLSDKLAAVYLVGSYPMGIISQTRPDINWLLVWKDMVTGEERWTLGNILTKAVNEFEDRFTVRPEFRPFKFSYPIRKTKYDVFVNLSNAYMASETEDFRTRNKHTPDYVFAGYKNSRLLILGEDILARMEFEVSSVDIIETGRQKLSSHKVQLDRIPLTYHQEQEADLIFNEALSHGKNLMYFGVEMLMTDAELRQNLFLDMFNNEAQMQNFYNQRLPEASEYIKNIIESKKNYPTWKYDFARAKNVYLAAYNFANLLIKYFEKTY